MFRLIFWAVFFFLGTMRIPSRSWLPQIFTSVTLRRMLFVAMTLITHSMKSWNVPRQMRYVKVVMFICLLERTSLPALRAHCFLFSRLLAGRFHLAGWWFIPREQAVTPMPPQLHHYAEKILHGRHTHTVRHRQWPDCELQHLQVSSAVFGPSFDQISVVLLH